MENKENILKLYDNYIDEIYTETLSKSEYTDKIKDIENNFKEKLSSSQIEMLDLINSYQQKQNDEMYKNIWITSYSLATKLIIEGLKE